MPSVRDIVLTVFIFALLPAVLVRPHWGILLWTWIGLMNPHKMTWGFASSFPFAMIVGLTTVAAVFISNEPKRFPAAPPIVVLLVFIVWMTLTTTVSLFPELAWVKWDKVIKIQFFILLTLVVMQSRERIQSLVLVATLSIAYFGIKGGIYTLMHGGGGMVLGPDGGFIAGNTEIALALTVTLPLMRWLQLQTQRRWLRRAATISMLLIAVAVLGSYSRGGLLALSAMAVFLWLKSRGKLGMGIVIAGCALTFLAFMPDSWHSKMQTIETYQEDGSAMGRLSAWKFAWNVAQDRPISGGGFDTFQPAAYAKYAPDSPLLDPHSIWFQVLAEHGFIGLALFLIFWILAWRTGSQVIAMARDRPELRWARELAGMIQASLVGFWVGGSFLGLAYWDYPYILVVVLVLARTVVQESIAEGRARNSVPPTAAPSRLRAQ